MLLILAFAEVASIVQVTLEYLVISKFLTIEGQTPSPSPSVIARMYRETFSYVAFEYLQVVANNLVTWAFSAKYWIVAYKVQLF